MVVASNIHHGLYDSYNKTWFALASKGLYADEKSVQTSMPVELGGLQVAKASDRSLWP